MKKVILSVLIILLLGGIVYLGFTVFDSKRVTEVELVGNVQTLYMVGEKLDFEDAKLKVTYKNGDQKIISLKNSDVKVKNFSTSAVKDDNDRYDHGTMYIIYKTKTIKVEYNVLATGTYYVSNTTIKTHNPSTGGTTISGADQIVQDTQAREYFYLGADGVLDYYVNRGTYANPKWVMFDGAYEGGDYKYYTKGDELVIKTPADEYRLKAEYDNGVITVKATNDIYSSDGLWKERTEIRTFRQTPLGKSNRIVDLLSNKPTGDNTICDFDFSETIVVTNPNEQAYNYNDDYKMVFEKNQTIKSSGRNFYLKVYIPNDTFLSEVFVHVTDEMFERESFNTSQPLEVSFAILYYEGLDAVYFYYSVAE